MADTEEIVVTGHRRKEVGSQHPIVQLKVAGQLHSGWKAVDIQRSIETIAGGFSLTMSDYDPAAGRIVQLSPGQPCELLVNGETVITGYIDTSGPEFDADTHEVKISGRDKTEDLVDCAAFVPSVNPGIWAKGQPVLQIVAQICQKSGIAVKQEVDAGSASLFALQPGETAFTAIDRLAKEAAVLPISDGMGGLVLTRGGLGSQFAALVEGKNMEAAKGSVSHKDRFSDYYVFADSIGIYVSDGSANMGHAVDPGVTRWRPTFITVNFGHDSSPAKLAAYANWVMSVHAGKALRHTVVATGWHDDTGLLWQPNGTVRVTSTKLGCDETLLIVSTRHIEDEQGTRTEIGVTRPDAFKLIPLDDAADLIIPGAGS